MAPNSKYKQSSQMQEYELKTALLQSETNCYLENVDNIFSYRKDLQQTVLHKKMKACNKLCSKYVTVPTLSIYYPPIYNYQIVNNWYQLQTPLFVPTVPTIPAVVPNIGTIFDHNSCSYANSLLQSMLSPIVETYMPQDYLSYNNESYRFDQNYCKPNVYNQTYCSSEVIVTKDDTNIAGNELANVKSRTNYPLDFYLALPREFFPPPRTLTLDPNPIIDEFCKLADMQDHTPWLLDLEFGIPRSPITRPIPTYSVKFNSINCKNTPDAIHPGFEICDPDFKRVLLFYYDCVVSAWYKGYVVMNYDKSVENFQSWLLVPMQVLGMCWP